MDLSTIVKLVDAGFTADEIRSWAVAKAAPKPRVRPSRTSRARHLMQATQPQPTQEAEVLQELPAGLPLNRVQSGVQRIQINRAAMRQSQFTAADLSEIPQDVLDFLKSALESAPGANLVSYDELKERVAQAFPGYRMSVYRAVKALFPTVTHTRKDGRGPYVLTDVAWRRK